MAFAQWNEMAEKHARAFGLEKQEVEAAVRERIDSNACEPYSGGKGRFRTRIKIRR